MTSLAAWILGRLVFWIPEDEYQAGYLMMSLGIAGIINFFVHVSERRAVHEAVTETLRELEHDETVPPLPPA